MKKLTAMYIDMQSRMQSVVTNDKGATMVEYSLMLALIAVVSIAAVTLIGTNTDLTYDAVAAAL